MNTPKNSHGRRTDIAVVGISAWYPCGNGLKTFWSNVVARRRAFRRLPERRLSAAYQSSDPFETDKTYVKNAAVIDGFQFDWVGRRIPKRVYESADIVHWLALEMAGRVIEDAGYTKDTIPHERMGVILGNTLTGEATRASGLRLRWPYVARSFRESAGALGYSDAAIDEVLAVTEDVFKSVFPNTTEDTLPGTLSNTIAGRVCNYFDMKGGGYTVDGACASSLIAISQAADALANHKLDAALAGGIDISIDPFELSGFARMSALAKEDMYVYEQRSQGFYPGEGCGWVMLKRLEDAERDGDYIYAVLKGWGISSDGQGGLTAPAVGGQALAIKRAYEVAGYRLADVDFVEGHGTGTVAGDLSELSALTKVLSEEQPDRPLGVTALKSMIGHCKAAAGIGSFIKAVLAVNQRVMPPLANCEKPHSVFAQSALYPILDGQKRAPSEIMRAGVSSFGFGGINVHVTVESAAPPHQGIKTEIDERALFVSSQDSEVFFFRAQTAEALQIQLEQLAKIADRVSFAEMVDLSAHLAKTIGDGPFRAAVIAANPEELKRKFETLLYMLKTPPTDGDVRVDVVREVWLSNNRSMCRVGFVFPGQGSQQLNMAKPLVERFDWARKVVAEADAAVGDLHGMSLSGSIFRPIEQAKDEQIDAWKHHLTQTEVCQPAICLASVLYTKQLQRLGIQPSAVGGHSLGELTAFWAAGALTEQQLLELARVRGLSMAAAEGASGAMASLRCSRQEAEAICAKVAGYVVIANVNSDQQIVVSGEPAAIDQVLTLAGEAEIKGQRLQVSNAFHSRYVQDGANNLAHSVNLSAKVPALTTKLFTGLDGREITEGSALQDHFPQQMVEQVDFVSLGAALANEVDLLIEVGPGRVLSGLLSNNSAAKSVMSLPVESQPAKYQQFNQVLAAFFVHGGALNLEALFDQRLYFPFVSPEDRIFIENPCEGDLAEADIPESFDRSLKGTFESQLPERTGYDKTVLEAYLEKRGEFLSQVIRADLSTAQLDTGLSIPPAQANGKPVTSVVSNGKAKSSKSSKTNGEVPQLPVGNEQSVEEIVIRLVAERTGFPQESIKPEMTFLNDLNIESIAAGEIIAKAAHQAGVGGKIDPGQFLQSSIREVAGTIRAITADAVPSKPATVNVQDKSGLLDVLERLTGKTSWVRTFDVRYTEEAVSPPASELYQRALKHKAVLVVSDPAHADQAQTIGLAFAARGAITRTTTYAELADYSGPTPDILIPLVPLLDVEAGTTSKAVRSLMQCLLSAAVKIRGVVGALIYVQFGGGYFGSRPELTAPSFFSAGAFAASFHHESRSLKVRVLDFAAESEAEVIANRVVDETLSEDPFVRAGYDANGIRRIVRPVVTERSEGQPRSITWSKDDVVVVTGGAKGATAELVLGMGRKTGARMVLIGRSKIADGQTPDGQEILATLERFKQAGIVCRYVSCDVTDAQSVAAALAEVKNELGPITGVIHGAGVNRPTLVGTETIDSAYSVVAPKVTGLINILSALDNAPPKIIVGLSSLIGTTGMPGSAWYGFANESLDRLLQRYRQNHPETAVLSLAYSLWESVGMGVKLHGAVDQLRRMGVSAIPIAQATDAFLDLVERDLGTEHVVVTARIDGLDTWCPDRNAIPKFRFLEEIATVQPRVELVAKAHLSLERDRYLLDHVYKGSYLFPMVFGLEAMAQAVATVLGRSTLGYLRIENIDLERPIVVDPKEGEEILVHAEVLERKAGDAERRIVVGVACHKTNFAVNHFSATFVVRDDEVEDTHHAFDRPTNRLAINPVPDLYGRFLFHGPMYQRLKSFYVLKSDYCVFDSEQQTIEEYGTLLLGDPFFRDSLMQAGQIVISQDRGLPRSIGCIEIYPSNGNPVALPIVEGVLNERTKEFVDCTLTVVDQSGRVLQRLVNCRFSIIEHLSDEPTAEEIAMPDDRDQRLLMERLQKLSTAFKVKLPAVAIANLPGVQELPPVDRHAREQFVLERAMSNWAMSKLELSSSEN
jgi:acyl transferase domain-containing protein/NAD(P)-dependent dehydrogenase (short-subunit alcohol dehydrogenase family)/acyl carrier protein